MPPGSGGYWHHVFSTRMVVGFVLINLRGARDVEFWEKLTVVPDPARTLPKAMMTAIVLVMFLYVTISLVVTAEVVAAKEYALAAFVVVALAMVLALRRFVGRTIKPRIPSRAAKTTHSIPERKY